MRLSQPRCSLHNLLIYRDPGHLAKEVSKKQQQLKVSAVWLVVWDLLAPLPFLSGYIEKEKGMRFETIAED